MSAETQSGIEVKEIIDDTEVRVLVQFTPEFSAKYPDAILDVVTMTDEIRKWLRDGGDPPLLLVTPGLVVQVFGLRKVKEYKQ